MATAPTLDVALTEESRTTNPRVTRRGVARGEWIKLTSVRSTVLTLIGGALTTVFFGIVFSATANAGDEAMGPGGALVDPVTLSLEAITVTQLILGVLGVLVVAGEYSTGLIRTTFTVVGSRLDVLWSKAAVVGAAVFVLMLAAAAIAVSVGQAVYTGDEATVAITDPDVMRTVLGAATYVTGIALIGVALGFLLRSTSGAIGTLVVGFFIGPGLLSLLPGQLIDTAVKYLPSMAGESMMTMTPGPDDLSVGLAFVVFGLWVAALLGAAAVTLVRRDA